MSITRDWASDLLLVGCCGNLVQTWSPFSPATANSVVYEAAVDQNVVTSVRFSPNRRALCFADGAGVVHIVSNGQAFPNSMVDFVGGISCVRFSGDGKHLFVSNKDQIHALDLKRQEAHASFKHTSAVSRFCTDTGDELLASAG